MSFSFNTTAGTSQSTAKPKLTGNNIYDVIFEACEKKDIAGVKDPTALYKQLIIRFSNENGVFEHTVWEPKPDDFNRRESEFKNKAGNIEKIPQASNVESMMLLFKHLIDSVTPAVAEAIDKKEKSLAAANWDELRDLIIKITSKSAGVKTQIKLLKNKDGEAIFPGFFTGLTKEGVVYVKNNFIGQKLSFTTYEMQRIKAESTAKPTPVSSFGGSLGNSDLASVSSNTEGLDLNFDMSGL